MSKTKYLHSAGGLIIQNNEVLLIHWDAPRSSYDFPKGTIERGESPEQACVREVLEETGFSTEIINYIGQTHYEYDWVNGKHYDKIVDYFLLTLTSKEPVLPRRELFETFDNVWLPIDEALEKLTRDIDKDILRNALEMLDTYA